MKLKILTPEKLILDQEVDSVTLPGSLGEMTILSNHVAMVATLKKGRLRSAKSGKEIASLTIDGGFVEVLKNEVLILTRSSLNF